MSRICRDRSVLVFDPPARRGTQSALPAFVREEIPPIGEPPGDPLPLRPFESAPERRPPRLLEQVRRAIHTRQYSRRTEAVYTRRVRRFVLFHGKRHPREMGESEVRLFLTHLAGKERVRASTQNQALSALLFLYREFLGIDLA